MTYAADPAGLSNGLSIVAKDNIIRKRMTNVVIILSRCSGLSTNCKIQKGPMSMHSPTSIAAFVKKLSALSSS
jgi:hypothetical protein